jgi:hypothetical protein
MTIILRIYSNLMFNMVLVNVVLIMHDLYIIIILCNMFLLTMDWHVHFADLMSRYVHNREHGVPVAYRSIVMHKLRLAFIFFLIYCIYLPLEYGHRR